MDDSCVRTTSKDSRRQTILDIARAAFLEEGYAAASMSAIALRLGGSKGTLYNYFASKEELFRAVIQDQCDRKIAGMYAGLRTDDPDVSAGLRALGQRYTTTVLSEDTVVFSRVLIAEALRFPELGEIMYQAGPRVTARRLADYLDDQMRAGRLRTADPRRAAEQFLELCLAGLYRQRLWNAIAPPVPAQIDENVEAALETFMAAYRVRAEGEPA